MDTTRVITLPRAIVSRRSVHPLGLAALAPGSTAVIDASSVIRHSRPVTDELVKLLQDAGAHRVIVVNANAAFSRELREAHRKRARPERSFLLQFQEVAAEALLRSA